MRITTLYLLLLSGCTTMPQDKTCIAYGRVKNEVKCIMRFDPISAKPTKIIRNKDGEIMIIKIKYKKNHNGHSINEK